jgi:hypothetical protein
MVSEPYEYCEMEESECSNKCAVLIEWDLLVALKTSVFSDFGVDDSLDHVIIKHIFCSLNDAVHLFYWLK